MEYVVLAVKGVLLVSLLFFLIAGFTYACMYLFPAYAEPVAAITLLLCFGVGIGLAAFAPIK